MTFARDLAGMSARIVLFVLIALAPVHAVAQQWKDAYDRRDFLRARELLEPIVLGADPFTATDPFPYLYLSTIYSEGLVLPRDEVLACTILTASGEVAESTYHSGHAITVAVEAVRDRICGMLTGGQREEALALMPPCVVYGLREQTFDLGPGHFVAVSRRGFAIDSGNDHEDTRLWNCPQQVPLVRYTRLDRAGADTAETRHLIEIFVWRAGGQDRERRALDWFLAEVIGPTLKNVAGEVLIDEPGSIWPARGVPETLEVRFGWNRAGEPTYRITGLAKPLSGVLPATR